MIGEGRVGEKGQESPEGKEFETLKVRYENQILTLTEMAALGLRTVFGILTPQRIVGSWLSTNPIPSGGTRVGIAAMIIVVATTALPLLCLSNESDVEKS